MKELPEADCRTFLRKHRVGVMALAKAGDAYAVPLFYAYDGQALYFHSHPGEKDAFLGETHEGCFVVVEFHGDDDWTSVQATGHVEKITLSDDATRALEAMSQNPFPPEFGTDSKGTPKRSSARMYLWMMKPRKLTGRTSRSLVRLKG
jgi:nitroimidazol reductase NimA-like FMN-containing flavoprotein (pyridoxamine 5'-phosphate oxidase superfamily)